MRLRHVFVSLVCALALLAAGCGGQGQTPLPEEAPPPATPLDSAAQTAPAPAPVSQATAAGPVCAMGQPPVPLPDDAQGCFFDAGVLVYRTGLTGPAVLDLYAKHFETEGGWAMQADALAPKWLKADQEVVLALVTETSSTAVRMEFRQAATP